MEEETAIRIPVFFNIRYRVIPTDELLGQCLQFPGIILSAVDLETLKKKMIDAIETFLSLHPDKIPLVTTNSDQNSEPEIPISKVQWEKQAMENVIMNVRRRVSK